MIGYYLLMTFLTEYAFGFVKNIQSSNSKKATIFFFKFCDLSTKY